MNKTIAGLLPGTLVLFALIYGIDHGSGWTNLGIFGAWMLIVLFWVAAFILSIFVWQIDALDKDQRQKIHEAFSKQKTPLYELVIGRLLSVVLLLALVFLGWHVTAAFYLLGWVGIIISLSSLRNNMSPQEE